MYTHTHTDNLLPYTTCFILSSSITACLLVSSTFRMNGSFSRENSCFGRSATSSRLRSCSPTLSNVVQSCIAPTLNRMLVLSLTILNLKQFAEVTVTLEVFLKFGTLSGRLLPLISNAPSAPRKHRMPIRLS